MNQVIKTMGYSILKPRVIYNSHKKVTAIDYIKMSNEWPKLLPFYMISDLLTQLSDIFLEMDDEYESSESST